MMGRARITYSNKDYESIRQELLARIPQLTDRWTDFNASDLGVVLLELFCGIGDMLAYYLDAQANEAFLPLARQRQNVINLCRLIGYRLDTPVAASTTLRFSLTSPLDEDLMIPAGLQCRASLDDGDVQFVTTESVQLAEGATSAEVGAMQGIEKTETFTSAGSAGMKLELSGKSIAQGSITLDVDGEEWTEVLHFQDSVEGDRHFAVETDALDNTNLFFGYGSHGATPTSGATITVRYIETLGEQGNIGAYLVDELLTPVYSNGDIVRFTVDNIIPATGGCSRESIDHARAQAPAELKTLWRAVTKQDYLALARGYPGIAKAAIRDRNDSSDIRYYSVELVIAPEGGGLPSEQLKLGLADFLERRKVITIEISIVDPVYVSADIEAEVYVYSGENTEVVRSRIEQRLTEFLDFEAREFGESVYFSDVVALIDGVTGVSHVNLYEPGSDIELLGDEIAQLGSVTLDMRSVS